MHGKQIEKGPTHKFCWNISVGDLKVVLNYQRGNCLIKQTTNWANISVGELTTCSEWWEVKLLKQTTNWANITAGDLTICFEWSKGDEIA